jgi:hypothetical protein
MRQVLVVVYSYTGTSRRVAQRLAAERGWPIAEVFDAKRRSGWLRCILDQLLRRRPPIRYDGPDPAAFDTVVLIAPIWVEHLAAPMRSFVTEHASRLRQVAAVSVMGSKGAPNAVAEIARLIGRRPALHAAFKTREVADGSALDRVGVFARAVDRLPADEERQPAPAVLAPTAG